MRRLVFVVLPALLVGCAPDLHSTYACAASDECPPDFTCWADERCHVGEPEYALGELCTNDTECDGQVCATSPDPMAGDVNRHCSVACDDDDDCTGYSEENAPVGAFCYLGVCRVACNGDRECAGAPEVGCNLPVPDPMLGELPPRRALCMDLRRNDLDGTRSCDGNNPMTAGNPCFLPAWCIQRGEDTGVCTMLCESRDGAQQCPMGSECVAMVPMYGACLQPCTDDATACDGLAGLSCQAHASGMYCMPESWAAAGLDMLPQSTGTLIEFIEYATGGAMMPPAMMP